MDKFYRLFLLAGLIIVLVACGDDSFVGDTGTTAGTGSTGSSGSSTTTVASINAVATLTAAGTGAATTQISESIAGVITITVTDGSTGSAISGALVTATTSTIATFNPAAGTALTGATGVATLSLLAGSSTGAGTVTIGVEYNSLSATLNFNYSIVQPTLRFGSGTTFTESVLELGVSSLSANGTTSVSARLIDENDAAYSEPVSVTFTSACVVATKASLDSPVTTINGAVNSTYLAVGCAGNDVITATAVVNGISFVATATVTVATASAGSIVFVGATPTSITLQGTGGAGRSETSTVQFQVVNTAGAPDENTVVDFVLSTTLGGLSLSQASALSNANGIVETIVQAGTVSTSVRITASVNGSSPLLTSQSDQLVVTTGIPDQNSYSMSLSTLNPNAWGYDGVNETVTVYMADHFNNPVPDDTAVTFQTEGGQIQSSCLTKAGTCSVLWTSSDPRPSNGRVTILATAIGEEGFDDTTPSDGRYNAGETFTDLGEAYRDDNENGVYDSAIPGAEEYLDFGGVAGVRDAADSQYNGTLCLTGCTSSLLHVRAQSILIMSSDATTPSLYAVGCGAVTGATATVSSITLFDDQRFSNYCIRVTDSNNQVPPSGTTVSATTNLGTIEGGSSTTPGDSIGSSSTLTGSIDLPLIIKGPACTPPACTGTLTLSVVTSGNNVAGQLTSTFAYNVSVTDVTIPTITTFSPTASIGIKTDVPIVVEFSENMDASTITQALSSVTLWLDPLGANTQVSAIIFVYDPVKKTLTFVPTGGLTALSLYEVRVRGAITDSAGNLLDANNTNAFTWRFFTE